MQSLFSALLKDDQPSPSSAVSPAGREAGGSADDSTEEWAWASRDADSAQLGIDELSVGAASRALEQRAHKFNTVVYYVPIKCGVCGYLLWSGIGWGTVKR